MGVLNTLIDTEKQQAKQQQAMLQAVQKLAQGQQQLAAEVAKQGVNKGDSTAKDVQEIKGTLSGMLKQDVKEQKNARRMSRKADTATRREKQRAQRKEKKAFTDTLKRDKKKEKKDKKSFLEQIFDIIGGIGGGLLGLGTSLAGLILSNPVTAAISTLFIGALSDAMMSDKVKRGIANVMDTIFEPIKHWFAMRIPGFGSTPGYQGGTEKTDVSRNQIQDAISLHQSRTIESKDSMTESEREENQKVGNELRSLLGTWNQIDKLKSEVARRQEHLAIRAETLADMQYKYEMAKGTPMEPFWWAVSARHEATYANAQADLEKAKAKLATAEKYFDDKAGQSAMQSALQIEKKQTGGVMSVPGSGSGDKVFTMLPEDSFVMNRNAFNGLQQGGIPTLLEPGEGVFMPGSWGPAEMMMNSMIPRFQDGGIVATNHPDTGSGYSVGKDYKGRPAVLSKAAAESFAKMMKASGGLLKPSDIWSAKRSAEKNASVKGVKGSNHLSGNAVDIHGASKAWMKKNASQYGWRWLDYPGHDGHFDYIAGKTGGTPNVQDTNESTAKSGENGVGGMLAEAADWLTKTAQSIVGSAQGMFADAGMGDLFKFMFGHVLGAPAIAANTATGDGTSYGNVTGASEPLTGDMQSKMKEMYNYIKSKGYSSAHAKGLVANAYRESSLNASARSGDDGGPGGLFQWKGSRQTAQVSNLVNSSNWKGQIDYALQEDVGPQYKGKSFVTAQAAADWWMKHWERPAHPARDSARHTQILNGMGFQQGGIRSMKGYPNANMNRFSKAQSEFMKSIAAGSAPIVIPVPVGGGGGGGVMQSNNPTPPPPELPAGPSVIAMLELQNRLAVGSMM